MVVSMASVVSEYCFTQGEYNDIMIMLADMDSEGAIDPVVLSAKKNYDDDFASLTTSMAKEEADLWLEDMNIEISALENR